MNRIIKALLFFVLAWPATGQGVRAETTVFVNVNVIPMSSDRVLRQQTVVVDGGRITEIGDVDSIAVPKGAQLIDGTDRFLMPGLAEMHAHVTSTAPEQVDRLMTLFVANGVTTIRGMLGRPQHLALRDELLSGQTFGPRLITSGPSLNGRSVAGAADAAEKVRQQKAAGYDFIKVHPGLSEAEFIALAKTANELDIPYAGHVPVAAGVHSALKSNMATIDHLDGYFAALLPAESHGAGGYGGFFDVMLAGEINADKIAGLAAATAAAGTWNVPTEVLIEQIIDDTSSSELRNRPEMRFVSKAVVDDWVASKEQQHSDGGFDADVARKAITLRRQVILELQKAGAGLLLGSDAPQTFNVPGFSTQRELRALVAAGLTPYEALYAGTAAVAEFLESNGGVVASGRDADLVLLDADPLENIQNSARIHGVMLRGTWWPIARLEARLDRYVVQDDR